MQVTIDDDFANTLLELADAKGVPEGPDEDRVRHVIEVCCQSFLDNEGMEIPFEQRNPERLGGALGVLQAILDGEPALPNLTVNSVEVSKVDSLQVFEGLLAAYPKDPLLVEASTMSDLYKRALADVYTAVGPMEFSTKKAAGLWQSTAQLMEKNCGQG